MMSDHVKRISISLLSAFVLFACVGSEANASHRLPNHGHWDKFGTARAYVRYVDYSGSAWPVVAAFNSWNANPRLAMGYYTNPSSCGGHCVNTAAISPANDPLNVLGSNCSGVLGYTTTGSIGGRNHFTEALRIRFNNSCNSVLTQSQRRTIVCHEMGHSVGLDHQGVTSSCMYTGGYLSNTPNAHDFSEIHNVIYNHPDNT